MQSTLPTSYHSGIAQLIHLDCRKNEAGYWQVRDQLLAKYSGQWIGFADGKVIASGSSPVGVFRDAEATGTHPFLICVGKEDQSRLASAVHLIPTTPVIPVRHCRSFRSNFGNRAGRPESYWTA